MTETLDDNGKMLYLTLEKAPQLTGLGPWMGVVQGEKQVDSDYPEEKKVGFSFLGEFNICQLLHAVGSVCSIF